MSYFHRKTACLIVLLMLIVTAMAYGADVTADRDTKFYRSPSSSSASVKLPEGTSLSLKDVSGKWAQVTWRGVKGYVPVKYLNSKTRASAYVSKPAYIYAGASTDASKKRVKQNTRVYVVGVSGDFCRVQNASGSVTGYILSSCLSSRQVRTTGNAGSWKNRVEKLNWYDGGGSVLRKGEYGYIYDINTGIVVHIKRVGGTGHADCEPVSRSDTAKLLKIAEGKFDWSPHPVILYAGDKFVACAISTKPHGDSTISSNGYEGRFCLYMTGSKAHDGNPANEEQQQAIQRAYKWAH